MIDWVMKSQGRELPACGRAVAGESSFFSRAGADRAQSNHGGGEAGGCRLRPMPTISVVLRQVVDYYHETLKAKPGGAEVSAGPRPGASGDGRALPAGIFEPDAWLPAAGEQTAKTARRSGAGCSGSASCAKAGTSTSTDRS